MQRGDAIQGIFYLKQNHGNKQKQIRTLIVNQR